jgi:hypothetical protein
MKKSVPLLLASFSILQKDSRLRGIIPVGTQLFIEFFSRVSWLSSSLPSHRNTSGICFHWILKLQSKSISKKTTKVSKNAIFREMAALYFSIFGLVIAICRCHSTFLQIQPKE